MRQSASGTSISWLPAFYDAPIPHVAPLDALIALNTASLGYDLATKRLVVHGKLDEQLYRALLLLYASHGEKTTIHASLRSLKEESQAFISDDVLSDLQEFARRIRGEIFFAHKWFLVEGQSEYMLAHAIGEAMGFPLDSHGVAVIDCQNNGSPASFAQLARGLAFPWAAVFDNDGAGTSYIDSIRNCGFSEPELAARCSQHAAGDLETQLIQNGLEGELRAILTKLGVANAATCDAATLMARLARYKTSYSVALATRLSQDPTLLGGMPQAMVNALNYLRAL